jgi:hypothetical protein
MRFENVGEGIMNNPSDFGPFSPPQSRPFRMSRKGWLLISAGIAVVVLLITLASLNTAATPTPALTIPAPSATPYCASITAGIDAKKAALLSAQASYADPKSDAAINDYNQRTDDINLDINRFNSECAGTTRP